jgi:flavodoxin
VSKIEAMTGELTTAQRTWFITGVSSGFGRELTRIGAAEELPIAALRRLGMTVSDGEPATLSRREFLRGALAVIAGAATGALMSGCSDPSPTLPTSTPGVDDKPDVIEQTPARPAPTSTGSGSVSGNGSKVLLAYFSRAGENYYYGGRTHLEVGNTEVLAGMISQIIRCDVHRIEPVDPYPDNYSETVERNVREQNADARPAIENALASIEPYDTVLLGSPIWNVRAPMIMSTFVEGFDFTGKTIFPFTTHAMSGLGTTVRDYTASCPGAAIGEGLAVRGEEVRDAGAAVESWLRRIDLLTSGNSSIGVAATRQSG